MKEVVRNVDVLTEQPVPDMSYVQLQQFTPEAMLARDSGRIDLFKATQMLRKSNGQRILAVDIGGTAIKCSEVRIEKGGKIEVKDDQITIAKEGDGANYFQVFQLIAKAFPEMPVAVCSAGMVSNNQLITCPNAPGLVEPLNQAGGFSVIFEREVPLMNDAEAGVIGAAVGVAMRDGRARPTIEYIKSGGIGGAAIDALGNRTSLEPGHIAVVDPALNPNNVDTPCKLFPDWNHVCLERIGASGAGIQPQWERLTGEKLDGAAIAQKMYMGDQWALQLYNTSALISAHVIEGIRSSLGFPLEDTVVVLSGGVFKMHGMDKRIGQIMAKNQTPVELVKASDLGFSNIGMAGLAISALMA